MQKKVKLQKTNAITVFGAGHQALAEIEGLRGMAVRGMFFNYLIFFAVSLALNGLFYFQLLDFSLRLSTGFLVETGFGLLSVQ